MSCILKEVASIHELPDLICWLCPQLNSKKIESLDSSDSGPDVKVNEIADGNSLPESCHGWLEECLVAISPTIDLIAIAARNRLAILTSRCEKTECGEMKSILSVNWKGVVGHEEEGDEITRVVCLPIISQKQSSAGAPDWTSVIVGFNSGFISFYTENGLVLLTQLFQDTPVVDITVRTYVPKNFGSCIYSDLTEELVILYHKCVVSIDGFDLLQTLKVCRNQVAKAAAIGDDCPTVASLRYKKFSLSEQEEVSGCVGTGMVPPHLYDHVMFKSNLRGFDQSVIGVVPTTTLLLTVGRAPFVASYSVWNETTQPFIADIAIHYASKIKNAIVSAATGWLFGNKNMEESTKKEKKKIEQPLHIPFRYTLPDKRRVGKSLQLSTSRRLATATDGFGRVHVIDVQKCCVVRIFKGYRDAECGWITIYGELGDTEKEVPFLIIYAPRRSLLEVWLPQQGPRVAAFSVPKHSKLIYTPHTLLGAHTHKGYIFPTTPVVLINSRGTLEYLSIPFHLALSGKTSKQARDVHLLKSLKVSLRSQPIDQILCLVREIKTTSIKIQAVNLMVNSKYLTVELALAVLDVFSNERQYDKEEREAQNLDNERPRGVVESMLLSQQLSRLSQLTQLFLFVTSLHCASDSPRVTPSETGDQEENNQKNLFHFLNLTEEEISEYLAPLNDPKLQETKHKKVKFCEEKLNFFSFLQCWEVNVGSVNREGKEVIPIALSKLTDEEQIDLGRFLFGWCHNSDQVKMFSECLRAAGTKESQMMNLCFVHWFSLGHIHQIDIIHFFKQILILAVFTQPYLCCTNPSYMKKIWGDVRGRLDGSNKPFHAFYAALVCRGIESCVLRNSNAIKDQVKELQENEYNEVDSSQCLSVILDTFLNILDKESLESDSTSDRDESWEEYSWELCEWNLIVGKLQKLMTVQKLYNVIMGIEEVQKPTKCPEYNIRTFALKGKGYLCELIARWLIQARIPVAEVINIINKVNIVEVRANEVIDPTYIGFVPPKIQIKEIPARLIGLEEQLLEVQKYFPHSTSLDALLLNLTWEYASAWKKSPNDFSYYTGCLQTLKNINNAYFKHGVCCMMWDTWVVHYVQATSQLMEKACRRPKDRVIMREIGISEFNLETFFSLTKDLLECLVMSNTERDTQKPPIVGKDDFWRDLESTPSLGELTVAQRTITCDLAYLHHQLVFVLYMIVKHELKNVKPYSLFPERDRAAFFKSLVSTWRLTSDEGREVVSSNQLSFLTRIVATVVIGLPDSTNFGSDMDHPSAFMEAIELGRSWGLAVDPIRRHFICELYSSGLDIMAEKTLSIIRDGVVMGPQMVIIAGQRIRHLIKTSPKKIKLITLLPANVHDWCKSLVPGNLRCPEVPLEHTVHMITLALNIMIDETSREYNIGSNLYRALKTVVKVNLFKD